MSTRRIVGAGLVVVVAATLGVARGPERFSEWQDGDRARPRDRGVTGALTPGTDAPLPAESKLLAPDGETRDAFGSAVALDGDTLVVGAFLDDDGGAEAGAAWVFRRGDSGWEPEAKLTPSDGEAFDFFGIAVALDGDRALVGALQDDDRGTDSGAAYVFERIAGAWSEIAKLTASDGEALDLFGVAVALDGDTAVVGARFDDDAGMDAGAAYVFGLEGGVWVEQAKLVAQDGGLLDSFGAAVALDGDAAVIGAPFDDDDGADAGAAYVFRRDGDQWVEEAKLLAAGGSAGSMLGTSVAVSGDTAVVGEGLAPGSAVHVFRGNGSGWTEEQVLTGGGGLGPAVSVVDDVLVAGAPGDGTTAPGAGAALVFRRQDTDEPWTEDQALLASDGEQGDRFGFAVSTDGAGIAVGADLDDDNGVDAGAAYVYEEDTTNLPPSADAGGNVSEECASFEGAVVTLDGSGSTDPDDAGAGTDTIALFEWFEDFELPTERALGTGMVLDASLGLGVHQVTLRVTDDFGASDTDTIEAAVVDTTDPEISVRVAPEMLWPPNHRLVEVLATIQATDACGEPSVVLMSIDSSEPDDAPGPDDGETSSDIRDADIGTADAAFRLRAERLGSGPGRVYTVRYEATDASDNSAGASAQVRVPHDRGLAERPGPPEKVKRGR